MKAEDWAAQDHFFAELLARINETTESAPEARAMSKSVISAKANHEQGEGPSGTLNAILPVQEALFEMIQCDPRHRNGRNQTAKQRNCD